MASGVVFVEVVMESNSFIIENVVGKRGTRLHRLKSPTRHRFKQYVAGRRIVRGGKIPISEEALLQNIDSILPLLDGGIIAIHTPERIKIVSNPKGGYVLTKAEGAVKLADNEELYVLLRMDGAAEAQEILDNEEEVPDDSPEEIEAEEVLDEEEAPEDAELPGDDDDVQEDLTAISGIGAGRAKKLYSAGVETFAKLANMEAEELANTVSVDADTAEAMISAAEEM